MKLYLLLLTVTFSIASSAQNFSVESTDTTFYGNITDIECDKIKRDFYEKPSIELVKKQFHKIYNGHGC